MNAEKTKIENLEKEGRTKQFIANEPRLSEAAELDKDAGYEMHLKPLPKEPTCKTCRDTEQSNGACRICYEGFEEQYKIIFTRPKEGASASDDELF